MTFYLLAAVSLVVPLALVVVGILWHIRPPKRESSSLLSYRTNLSQRSEETWKFAHRMCARIWLRMGVILGAVTLAVLVIFNRDCEPYLLWIIVGQMILLCVSVLMVDVALKSGFDENGKPVV